MQEERNLVGCLLDTAGVEETDTELTLGVRWQSVMREDVETSAQLGRSSAPYRPPPLVTSRTSA